MHQASSFKKHFVLRRHSLNAREGICANFESPSFLVLATYDFQDSRLARCVDIKGCLMLSEKLSELST